MRTTTDVLPRRPFAAIVAALAALAVASLGLAACGGSSGSSSNGASGSGTTTGNAAFRNGSAAKALHAFKQQSNAATNSTPVFKRQQRPDAFRECLGKNGVKMPSGHNGLFQGGNLPKGVSRQQLQAAVRKCLAGRFSGASRPGLRPGVAGSGPGAVRFRQALAKFAACLRQNGVNVPAPNPSGHGPLFSTKGIDTASTQFKAATAKCRTALTSALRGR